MALPNKTRVQVATDPAFSNVIHDVQGDYTTELQIAEDVLPKGINLYTRGMHGHPTTGDSSWSTTVQFQIKLAWSNWDGSANGIEYALNSTNSAYLSVSKISETKAIVTYANFSHSLYLYSLIVSINGSAITVGTPVQCNSHSWSYYTTTLVLSETKAIVLYRNDSPSGYLHAILLNINNMSISVITNRQCNSNRSSYVTAVVLSGNRVVVNYNNHADNYKLYSMILTVSDTSITPSPQVKVSEKNSIYISTDKLNDNRVLVSCREDNVNGFVYTVLLEISGTTIVVKDTKYCNNTSSEWVVIKTISDTKALISYRSPAQNGNIYSILLNLINDTIYALSPVRCNTHDSFELFSIKVIENHAVLLLYRNATINNYMYGLVMYVKDDTITLSTPIACTDHAVGQNGDHAIAATLLDGKIFMVYTNAGVSIKTVLGKVLVDN